MPPEMKSALPRQAARVMEIETKSEFDLDSLPAGIRATLEATALQKSYSAARFAPKDASDLRELAAEWYDSDLLPEAYYPVWEDKKTKQAIIYTAADLAYWRKRGISRATIVMRYGAALGVLPELAIRMIYIIDGQPSPAAALMLAIFLASPICAVFEPGESTKEIAKMRVGRKGQKPFDVSATYAEYKHLHIRTVWCNYPIDMVYARCLARAMRRVAPDLFAGVYCAEERGDMRADRAAGYAEDPLERILAAVDTEERAPTPRGDAPTETPIPATETPQEAPAKPVLNAKTMLALEARLATVGDSATAEDIAALRADVEAYRAVSEIGFPRLIAAWGKNPMLGAWVPS